MPVTIIRTYDVAGAGQWECPATIVGAILTRVQLWAGGAGGGSATGANARGGGGSAGCYVESADVPVTPGTFYDFTIAAFVLGSADGQDTSWDGGTVLAKGGKKGGDATAGVGGAAGIADTTGCVGDTIRPGGDGSAGVGSGSPGAGGGGPSSSASGNDASGATPGAATGEGGIGGTPGTAGAAGGNGQRLSGGGGGGNANSATLRAGGGAEGGRVVLTYDLPDDSDSSMVTVACDAATGGDDSDIDGREFDGCGTPGLAAATWGQSAYNLSNQPGNEIQIVDGQFVKVGIDEQHYEANP